MIDIPPNYFESKFFEYVGFAKKQLNGNMVGSCPFCLEDSSWGRKKRFYYYADTKGCKCFNCGIYCDELNFLKKMEGIPFSELLKNIKAEGGEFHNHNVTWIDNRDNTIVEPKEVDLPRDAINLFNKKQISFYRDDFYVKKAIQTIKERRLDMAKFQSDLYISREDFIHKNRIIIPFKNEVGDVVFYQSRAQTNKQMEMGKYISSLNGRKIFFGMDRVDSSKENIFVIEGPLDCFFVENSIGGGGIEFNSKQRMVLEEYEALYDVIYCLDNDFNNKQVVKKYSEYIKKGKKVFMWGGKFSKYKDFNEYCVGEKLTHVDTEDILKNSFEGLKASKLLVGRIKSAFPNFR